MALWTIFYWGWCTSWATFVGVFPARITKGSTISELIMYSIIAPPLYCIRWFGVFSGAAIKTQWKCDNAFAANIAGVTNNPEGGPLSSTSRVRG